MTYFVIKVIYTVWAVLSMLFHLPVMICEVVREYWDGYDE